MKMIHCADMHLDSKLNADFPLDKAEERRTEILQTFERMVVYAAENDVSAILITGGLFDTKVVASKVQKKLLALLEEYSWITFYYLKGSDETNTFLSALEEMPANLKTFGTCWTSYTANERTKGNICVTGVEINEENAEQLCSRLSLKQDMFNIVLLYGKAQEGEAVTDEISLPALRNRGIDVLAMGGRICSQVSPLDGRGIYCYAGSLEGSTFEETGEHGFVVLDIDEEAGKCTSSFVPFACRRFYDLSVDVSDCETTGAMLNAVRRVLTEENIASENLVKIRLTGEVSAFCEKNIDSIAEAVRGDYYLVKICDETGLEVSYDSFSCDESLKGEFVRSVLSDLLLAEEDKNQIIRYGMQALSGEDLN